jgi:SNF2 family DNA or RNA helicase
VGLGKTIEAGVLLTELIKRGRGERILVVAVRSMLAQFQQEMWARFAIPLVRLDSVGLRRVRAKIPSNKNPFYYYNRVIISIDTLKNDAQYRHYLEQSHWDVIVIDECHNVANAGSQRNRLANLLARTCDSLIMTSATPHNGQPESFANLINMLDPTAIADVQDYTAEEIKGLFVRRFKKDVEEQVRDQFSERTVRLEEIQASAAEERFFDALAEARFTALHRSGGAQDALYRVGLLKSFLSSPAACVKSINGRLRRIEKHIEKLEFGEKETEADEIFDADNGLAQLPLLDDPLARQKRLDELHSDHVTLSRLHDLAEAVDDAAFSKYQRLVQLLRELGVDASADSERIIIFSERIATLYYLQERLIQEFRANKDAIVVFHAGLPDIEQQDIVEDFGKADSPKRILLASDVASEGVNLHYYCHLMVHFDIPWSLITMEQRNGRIDRYGQHVPPEITYLITRSRNPVIRGDLRILDRLIEKEQEAHKNIGDAATLLGLYDARKEEDFIVKQVALGAQPEEIIPDEPEDEDWLSLLMEEESLNATGDDDGVVEPFSL